MELKAKLVGLTASVGSGAEAVTHAPRALVAAVTAWGVVVGALLHFGLQVPGLRSAGMRYSAFRINLGDEGVRQVGRLLLPRVAGQAAFQTNIVAMKAIASFLSAAFAGACWKSRAHSVYVSCNVNSEGCCSTTCDH